MALTHYSLTGESRGTSFCLELPTPGGFVNFSTVSVGKWLVLPLDCLLIYLRKKDPSRGGLGSFVFTPVCPRLWLCMAWAGFFCAVIGRCLGFYTTTSGLFASLRVGVLLFTRLQRAKSARCCTKIAQNYFNQELI